MTFTEALERAWVAGLDVPDDDAKYVMYVIGRHLGPDRCVELTQEWIAALDGENGER